MVGAHRGPEMWIQCYRRRRLLTKRLCSFATSPSLWEVGVRAAQAWHGHPARRPDLAAGTVPGWRGAWRWQSVKDLTLDTSVGAARCDCCTHAVRRLLWGVCVVPSGELPPRGVGRRAARSVGWGGATPTAFRDDRSAPTSSRAAVSKPLGLRWVVSQKLRGQVPVKPILCCTRSSCAPLPL